MLPGRLAIALGLLLSSAPLANALDNRPTTAASPSQLNPGDIIRTDSGDALQGACLLKVDPATGQETVLAQGGFLRLGGSPMGVACDRSGHLLVANQDCLLRVDPVTKTQSVLQEAAGAGKFMGLVLDRRDDILVAAETAILRVNAVSGSMQVVSSGGWLNNSATIALGGTQDRDIFTTSVRYEAGIGWVGSIIRVNARDGRQTLVADAGYLGFLLGLTVQGDDIYVTGMQGHDQNFGIGQVVHVDARTGQQTVVTQGEYLVRPFGITMDQNGQLLVADPYTINPESADLFDGAIVRIDPVTGAQALVVRGSGSLVNPCGVAVVPATTRGH
jgi:hypothetical protein